MAELAETFGEDVELGEFIVTVAIVGIAAYLLYHYGKQAADWLNTHVFQEIKSVWQADTCYQCCKGVPPSVKNAPITLPPKEGAGTGTGGGLGGGGGDAIPCCGCYAALTIFPDNTPVLG